MHDRPAAGADGLFACPFLALAGDRDVRIDVPDRRHRCYAEPEPAPRAIAHQREYCLSASFAACPTFQDWARREAARVVGSGEAAAIPEGAAALRAPAAATDEGVVWRPDDAPPREARSEPTLWGDGRAWAAPPPWLGEPADDTTSSRWRPGTDTGPSAEDRARIPGAARDEPEATRPDIPVTPLESAAGSARASSGSARAAPVPAVPHPEVPPTPSADDHDLPAFLADNRARVGLDRSGVRGTANRPSGPPGGHDAPREAGEGGTNRAPAARPSPDLRPDGTPRPGRAAHTGPASLAGGDGDAHPPLTGVGRAVPPPRRASTARGADAAPDWERPLRREAYPSLHMPLGLPHVPRLGLGVVALLVAAVVLFLAPTLLPGFFGAQPVATSAPAPSAAPSVSIAPTPPPLPTPFVYTVVQGDTLSGLAARYGLTVSQLMKANPQIKNENKLVIGDRLTIPVSSANSGGLGATALPSGLPAP